MMCPHPRRAVARGPPLSPLRGGQRTYIVCVRLRARARPRHHHHHPRRLAACRAPPPPPPQPPPAPPPPPPPAACGVRHHHHHHQEDKDLRNYTVFTWVETNQGKKSSDKRARHVTAWGEYHCESARDAVALFRADIKDKPEGRITVRPGRGGIGSPFTRIAKV